MKTETTARLTEFDSPALLQFATIVQVVGPELGKFVTHVRFVVVAPVALSSSGRIPGSQPGEAGPTPARATKALYALIVTKNGLGHDWYNGIIWLL